MSPQSPVQLAALKGVSPKRAVTVIMGVSLAALALLVVVIYGHGRATQAPEWVGWLPALNAVLNGTSAVFLVLALRAIKSRRIADHSVHGDTKFAGHGAIRPVYFFILISHIALSAVVLPLIFSSFFFSLSGRFPQHKKISRYTMPVWLYVSVTGVLVFALLRAYG